MDLEKIDSQQFPSVDVILTDVALKADLIIPKDAKGIVVFAHGSGSSRHSPRNKYVANILNEAGLATLLIDLLTEKEEAIDNYTAELRFNIPLLADRLVEIVKWVSEQSTTQGLKIGLFGSSTGGGAALVTSSKEPKLVKAVVSRGGRPDLAGEALPFVKASTLLIVGGLDSVVIELNRQAQRELQVENVLEIVEGATHLFEEPGTLDEVANLAAKWFKRHLV